MDQIRDVPSRGVCQKCLKDHHDQCSVFLQLHDVTVKVQPVCLCYDQFTAAHDAVMQRRNTRTITNALSQVAGASRF